MILPENNYSRQIVSSQREIHPRLGCVLDAHFSRDWQAPLHPPSVAAFRALQSLLADDALSDSAGLVLDSGCGTGESTRQIARQLPDCVVIGVDKSLARLSRTGAYKFPHRQGNAIWLRADLTTFWRLAVAAGWRLHRHFLLYPNPWPKPAHLRRRWHAHPVFPDLLRLGGRLEMRSNWGVYALEFTAAVNRMLGTNARLREPGESPITSPYERKYRASGHRLYSLSVSGVFGGV